MNITAEYTGIDSECHLFREIKGSYLSSLIERSVYNRRRKRLFDFIELVRKALARPFHENETHYIVDSMPLKLCQKSREKET